MDAFLSAQLNKTGIKKTAKAVSLFLAEEKGFEPLQDLHLLSVFETDPFSRLGIPPNE